MKYESEIIIERPQAKVIALFDDPDNLARWQPTLQSFEHLSGEAGQPGAGRGWFTWRMAGSWR